MDAEAIYYSPNLSPHPKGGWYRQNLVAENTGRPMAPRSCFLLPRVRSKPFGTLSTRQRFWFLPRRRPLILSRSCD